MSRAESVEVQAAASTPTLVGRATELATLRAQLRCALGGRGGAIVMDGPPGIGHSRLLDACALEAKTLGLTVLRGSASEQPFAMARQLASQALEELPEASAHLLREEPLVSALLEPSPERNGRPVLRDFAAIEASADASTVQAALGQLLLQVSQSQALAVLVDDAHLCDAESVAVLAVLASLAERKRLLLVMTCAMNGPARTSAALDVVRSYASPLKLEPLSRAETHALLASMFGDVPNLALLTEHVHLASKGLPRECMEMAEHFVGKGIARYSAGTWSLPELLDVSTLPASAAEVLRRRVAELSPLARELARGHALCVQRALDRKHYTLLAPAESASAVDRALSELLASGLLSSNGTHYRFANHAVVPLLEDGLSDAQRLERHAALSKIYVESGGSPVLIVHHMLREGRGERHRVLPAISEDRDGRELAALRRSAADVSDFAGFIRARSTWRSA